jgi:hypothetical protein
MPKIPIGAISIDKKAESIVLGRRRRPQVSYG